MIRRDLVRGLSRAVLLAVSLALAAPGHAGIGDKLKDKLKALKVPPQAKTTATAETGPIPSRIQPPCTPENVAKFNAAMGVEKAEREKVLQLLASAKSPEAYAKCRNDYLMSEEGQKFSQAVMDASSNSKPDEYQKKLVELSEQLDRKLTARCGPDPDKLGVNWRGQAMRDAVAKGSDTFVKDDIAYQGWKEWVGEFCKYAQQLEKEPDGKAKLAKIRAEGVRIPGTGEGVYFVYTAAEAAQLLDHCDELLPLVQATV